MPRIISNTSMRYLPYLPQYYSNQPTGLDPDIFAQYQSGADLGNPLLSFLQYYPNQPVEIDPHVLAQYQSTYILRNYLLNYAKAYNKHHTFVQRKLYRVHHLK